MSSPDPQSRTDKTPPEAGFYGGLPVIESFAQLADPAVYRPVPEGWVLGLADIVQSTAAIEAGHYKTVNTAAAAVIAAVANTLPESDFPFVFGGDGASFALPPEQAERGRAALASVAAWTRDDLGLDLRIALVPVEAVRAEGLDCAHCALWPFAGCILRDVHGWRAGLGRGADERQARSR
jgi:hypothetical protein